jgi:chromosomal replication initiator protein
MRTIWEDVKAQVKTSVPEKTFSLWVNPIQFIDQKENNLVLGCPNKFFKNWIKENYLPLMEEKLFAINQDCQFQLKVLPLEKRNVHRIEKRENKQLPFRQ